MRWFRSVASGLAAGIVALGATSAQAGKLEIIYWGDGQLEWLQIDGASYSVTDGTVVATDIYEGWHSFSYGANGSSRSFSVYLSSDNAAGQADAWCMSLELDTYELLDDYDCEDMWDWYWY